MPQLLSSRNLLLSSRPLVVGVVAEAAALDSFVSLTPIARSVCCDAVELRLDTLRIDTSDLLQRLAGIDTPILITARHPAEGGEGPADAVGRLALLEPFLQRAALCDVELRSLPEMRPWVERAQRAGVGIVGSFHDFQHTPSDEVLEGAVSLAEAAGVDTVKIATFLNEPADLTRLIRFVSAQRRLRVSAMGMGPLGRVSRLVLAKCGSLLNYGYLGAEGNVSGQWSASRLKALLEEL